MTTTTNNRTMDCTRAATVQLTEQEKKLIDQIDKQRSNRQILCSKLAGLLLSTPLLVV